MNYYKILNKTELHYNMQYQTGLNVNCEEFIPKGDCDPGGMYFSREDILAFLDYGPWIRQVTLCPDSKVYENPGNPIKWKADKFILGERRKITAKVIKELIDEGANVHADHDFAIKYSSEFNKLNITKILVEKGADIHIMKDYPLRWASGNGHLKIINFLVENGADIHSKSDISLVWSALSGHLDVVEYLIKKGCDVNSINSVSVKNICNKKYFDVIKCLIKYGYKITEKLKTTLLNNGDYYKIIGGV